MEESKVWYKSKRVWTGILSLATASVSMFIADEKTVILILGIIGLIQTYFGITTNTPISVGGKVLGKK